LPYQSNKDLPARVREGMPEHAQSIFRNVFNNVMNQDGTEESSAFAQAYGALENVGYKQNTEGKWVKVKKYNSKHDRLGRFASGDSRGAKGSRTKNKSPEIGNFKSSFEAETVMSKKYSGKQFNFGGADTETLNPSLQQFDKLATQFPESASSFKGISVESDLYMSIKGGGNGVYANMSNSGIMHLNSNFYGRSEAMLKQVQSDAKSKWHPKGSEKIESIITHEFAHHISNHITRSGDETAKYKLAALQAKLMKKDRVIKEISKYGAKNFDEAFAEAFVAYEHGGVRTGLAKQVGEFVYQYAK